MDYTFSIESLIRINEFGQQDKKFTPPNLGRIFGFDNEAAMGDFFTTLSGNVGVH